MHLDKENIVRCTCRQAWHKRTRSLVQKFTGSECDHIRALFEGRVHEGKKTSSILLEYRDLYGGTALRLYRIIVTDFYRAEFEARQVALALTADTKGNAT